MSTTRISFDDNKLVQILFGEHNSHLNYLEKALSVEISDRGNELLIAGEDDRSIVAASVLERLYELLQKGRGHIDRQEIDSAIRFVNEELATHSVEPQGEVSQKPKGDLTIETRKKSIVARTPNQRHYLKTVLNNEVVFGLGPAGTGKTYLAVAVGVQLYLKRQVERLIFCRPAVEAGENLGFLPGDMKEKVDPYLRPIYDALHDMLPRDQVEKKIESGDIEIAPLAFMRGRTLSNAFVILDESQNTTPVQMKMILTRLGENSRMVITGDPTQIDLPKGQKSGLIDAMETLMGVDGISFVTFDRTDVVRHHLVARIVEAYETRKQNDD